MKRSVLLRALGFISTVFGGVVAAIGVVAWLFTAALAVRVALAVGRVPPGQFFLQTAPIVFFGTFMLVPSAVVFAAGVSLLRERPNASRLALQASALSCGCAFALPITAYVLVHVAPYFGEESSPFSGVPLGIAYGLYAAVAGLLLFLGRPGRRAQSCHTPDNPASAASTETCTH